MASIVAISTSLRRAVTSDHCMDTVAVLPIVQRLAWGVPFECVAPVQAIAVSEYTLFVPCRHQRVAVSIFSEIGFARSIRTSFAPHKADFASCLGMGHVLDGKYMDHGPRHFVQFSAKRSRFC